METPFLLVKDESPSLPSPRSCPCPFKPKLLFGTQQPRVLSHRPKPWGPTPHYACSQLNKTL